MYNRKLAAVIAALLVIVAVLAGQVGKPPARPEGYVADQAGAFNAAEQSSLAALCSELRAEHGYRFYVAAVKSTGTKSTEKYVDTLWSKWNLGSYDLLLLLVTDGEDYYFAYGDDSATVLDNMYDDLLQRWLEPEFAAGNYGSGAVALVQAVGTALDGASGTTAVPSPDYYVDHAYTGDEFFVGFGGVTFLIFAAIVLFVIIIVASSTRRMRRYRSGTIYPGDVYYPPRPRPHGPRPPRGGFGPGPGMFGGGSRPPHSGGHSSFGGFSGGGRSSFGGGRSSFGGGGRSGGFSGGGRSSGGHSGGGRSGGGRSGGGRH